MKLFFIKKSLSFKESFSAICPYIHEIDVQNMLLSNINFVNKYNKYSSTIDYFISQIKMYYSDEEIRYIIDKYIIPLDDEQLLNLMTNYLNLSINDKMSKKYFKYYDDAHDMVNINDVEANEEKLLNEQLKALCEGKRFNGINLSALYKDLDIPCKRYLLSILKNDNCYLGFVRIFENNYHFKSLLRILVSKSIDSSVLNFELTDYLGETVYRKVILTLMSNNNLEIARYIKVLIDNKEYESIYGLALGNLLSDNIFKATFRLKDDKFLTEQEIIKTFEKVKVKHDICA